MKINNYSLEKLRKDYAQSTKFIIRIRDKQEEETKKECNDIVYCEGIKAFYVENKECTDNTVKVNLPENIYKINQTNLYNIIKKNEDLNNIEKDIDDFIRSQATLKEKLETYFKNTITGGYFKFGKVFITGTKKFGVEEIKEQVKERLKKLNEKLVEIGTGFDLENIIRQLDNIKNKDEKVEFKLKNIEKLSTCKLTKIEALMILYTTFKLESQKITTTNYSGLAKPEFKYDSHEKMIDSKDLAQFNEKLQKAISNYEENTKVELEKKYQHSFMIENKLKNYSHLSSVIPFEEEYYTFEKDDSNEKEDTNESNNERGRIDCIFVNPKESQSDIYLIELKVNEGVIGEKDNLDEHGINTHLVDIDNLIKNKEGHNLQDFVEKLVKRYNYRNAKLGNHSRINDKENCNLHYWLICAIYGKNYKDEKEHAEAIWKKITALKSDKYINGLNKEYNINFLDESSKESYLKTYDNKKCDIKLLFNIWNSKEYKENMENNKFLTIEEFKEYYDLKDK